MTPSDLARAAYERHPATDEEDGEEWPIPWDGLDPLEQELLQHACLHAYALGLEAGAAVAERCAQERRNQLPFVEQAGGAVEAVSAKLSEAERIRDILRRTPHPGAQRGEGDAG